MKSKNPVGDQLWNFKFFILKNAIKVRIYVFGPPLYEENKKNFKFGAHGFVAFGMGFPKSSLKATNFQK